jgi:hypothetical protein
MVTMGTQFSSSPDRCVMTLTKGRPLQRSSPVQPA